MLSDSLGLVPMNRAPDAYLLLVVKSPNVVYVAVSDGNLPLGLNEGIFLVEGVFEVLALPLLLCEDIVLCDESLSHDLSHSIYCVVVHWLVLVRGLIHSQEVQNVLIITLINEELVLILLDDNIPRVERLRSGHDS